MPIDFNRAMCPCEVLVHFIRDFLGPRSRKRSPSAAWPDPGKPPLLEHSAEKSFHLGAEPGLATAAFQLTPVSAPHQTE